MTRRPAAADVRRGDDRFRTTTTWLDSRHSFSFGPHYDPGNTSFGLLVAHNEDVVQPAAGFEPHPHRDLEILTWVLQGSLVHEDSAGHRGTARPGLVQWLGAGTGVVHSERNQAREPVHLVQMWVVPDQPGLAPAYAQRDVTDALRAGELVPVASGMERDAGTAGVRIRNRSAALHVARLPPGGQVELPEAPHVHLFVASGRVTLAEAGMLQTGDAVRLTVAGGHRLTAAGPAEVLVWEMHGAVGR